MQRSNVVLPQPDVKRYGEEDGLPANLVYGLLGDGRGNLWLSSDKGLTRFDPRTERFRTYDWRDGLQGDEFNGGAYHRSPRGELFFGGVNGFNAFFPEGRGSDGSRTRTLSDRAGHNH